MSDRRLLDAQEASRRRQAWLDGRHRWHRDLVLILLHYAPEVDIAHALDQLPAGALGQLAQLLSQATDLHQVARAIAADLHEQLDGRPPEPPSYLGPATASSACP
jgi:hypothetical protein